MRLLYASLAAALLASAGAHAQDAQHVVTNPHWLKLPSADDLSQYWPVAGAGLSGSATMKCMVTSWGLLEKCAVSSESPPDHGFGGAALRLAPLFVMQPKTVDGVPVGGAVINIPIRFNHQTVADSSDHIITNPRWLKLPSQDDLDRFWPAASGSVSGKARISCIVTSRGTLDRCALVSEEPTGHGFGGTALLLAPLFVMQPKTVDGIPVSGARVSIPINFNNRGLVPGSSDAIRIANNLPWSTVPTASALAAAFPDEAEGHASSGHVVLRCRVADDGGLKSCQTAMEEPRGDGFAMAARRLAQSFRVLDELKGSKQLRNIFVDVPFDFRDPGKPSPPMEVNDPEWLAGADPVMAGKLFPDAAAQAGLKTGRAFVTCEAAHDGSLTHCVVTSEDQPGLGFGASALAIAGVMRMNPWTKQGYPVDGARIVLPIRVNYSDGAQPNQSPSAPSPTPPAPPPPEVDTISFDKPFESIRPGISHASGLSNDPGPAAAGARSR